MAAPTGNFFDTVKRSFADVPIKADNEISTSEFLEAAESLTTLFDVLGSVAFTPVKTDMTGNIEKVRERQLKDPAAGETLQGLVKGELKLTGAEKTHKATEGLLWLTRGLDFTRQGLSHNLADPKVELSNSFREAYGKTLKPHHSFVVKPVFSMAMSATPYRKDFYAKMGDDQTKVEQQLEEWLKALEKIVGILNAFLASKDAKWK
ncbi:putative glycolipid transfer protein HET-C2 [Aulographum hederae CBS 113979]|uniref:Putative glycolipid transfer protein HET-C2 n=1 Tax=Aulographum hederae CBS 113979 TaxID=1176131 RepID=A0A6G1HH92_9PEZI|nr:putative glycolipid transfer protein HET-C2 [Aulographum hederae CBS 113979]